MVTTSYGTNHPKVNLFHVIHLSQGSKWVLPTLPNSSSWWSLLTACVDGAWSIISDVRQLVWYFFFHVCKADLALCSVFDNKSVPSLLKPGGMPSSRRWRFSGVEDWVFQVREEQKSSEGTLTTSFRRKQLRILAAKFHNTAQTPHEWYDFFRGNNQVTQQLDIVAQPNLSPLYPNDSQLLHYGVDRVAAGWWLAPFLLCSLSITWMTLP